MTDPPAIPEPPAGEVNAEVNQAALNQIVRTICLAGGAFSPIFAHCDYPSLRDRLLERLQATCDLSPPGLHHRQPDQPCPLVVVDLDPAAVSLFAPIHQAITGQPTPAAVVVVGLEGVERLDGLLAAANQMREEFRAQVKCPTIFWVTEDVLRRWRRRASDFANWGTTVRFAIPTEDPIALVREWTDRLIERILAVGSGRFISCEPAEARELESARQLLRDRGLALDPGLESSLELALAQDESLPLADAQPHYELSLTLARAASDPIREGCTAFYYCLWWRRVAVDRRQEFCQAYTQARQLCEQAIAAFERAQRADLVGRFIGTLGAILRHLHAWSDLQITAQDAAKLHEAQGDRVRLAYDYGLLAAAAIGQERWVDAKNFAQLALRVLPGAGTGESEPATVRMRSPTLRSPSPSPSHLTAPPPPPQSSQADPQPKASATLHPDEPAAAVPSPPALAQAWRSNIAAHPKSLWHAYDAHLRDYHRSFYLHSLGQALAHLGDHLGAIETIEEARRIGHPRHEPELYIGILRDLRNLHFQAGDYLRAYERKQERQEVEAQYRLRPFVGARSLRPVERAVNPVWDRSGGDRYSTLANQRVATGRAADVSALRNRLADNRYKLIVLHGESGVGKSSLLRAGLIPKLAAESLGPYRVLSINLRNYVNWLATLAQELRAGLQQQLPGLDVPEMLTVEEVLACLRLNGDRNLLVVLIFDQFEEFFFVEAHQSRTATRYEFYDFLGACLQLFDVKIILSLREDYLHYLLELEARPGLSAIDNDILKKDIRYALTDFSRDRAEATIRELIKGSQFALEADLIHALVEDLTDETGLVRPIELQVIGAQLQEEKIFQLAQYRQIGPNPKQELVGRSLAEVASDCGPENEQVARSTLYLLTSENGTRPLKTRHELDLDLQQLGLETSETALDLVLAILVGSGLVFWIPDEPVPRYQLVHDYLVPFIRDRQAPEIDSLAAELAAKRDTRHRLEVDLSGLHADIEGARQERDRLRAEIAHLQAEQST